MERQKRTEIGAHRKQQKKNSNQTELRTAEKVEEFKLVSSEWEELNSSKSSSRCCSEEQVFWRMKIAPNSWYTKWLGARESGKSVQDEMAWRWWWQSYGKLLPGKFFDIHRLSHFPQSFLTPTFVGTFHVARKQWKRERRVKPGMERFCVSCRRTKRNDEEQKRFPLRAI